MSSPSPSVDQRALFRHRMIAIGFSFVIGITLMLMKFYVYWLTHSAAILSDALESIINVVASAFAAWSIILSAKPPDHCHPYGHGKIEFFSAGFEGALIILAAVGIVRAAVPQMLNAHELPNLTSGLWILLSTSAVNMLLGVGLIGAGRKTRSLVLVADGRHILTDVYTSVGVLLGLALVNLTGWYWVDGAIACLVGVNILVVGSKLVREAFAGLMDASDPQLLEEITRFVSRCRRSSWIDIHRLRAWRSGNRVYVDFHLILPRELTLEEAHREVDALEVLLKTSIPGMEEALIHAEPCIDPECPICGYDPCQTRSAPTTQQSLWFREDVAGRSAGERRRTEHEGAREVSGDE